MESKRELGQFYTDYNPFKHKVFVKWFKKALKESEDKVLEPFAGSNNLIEMLKEDFIFSYESYDIHPGRSDVKKRDTLKKYPLGFNLAITNPPYLSKVSAKRKGLNYPDTDFPDLYKLCLEVMLENNKYVAAIIPINIIRDEHFKSRLDKYIILNKKMFNTTETPVCLAMFSPLREIKSTEVYDLNRRIGNLEEIDKYIDDLNTGLKSNINFNSKSGKLFLRAVDNPKGNKIQFGDSSNFSPENIKVSSRHLTLIEVPFEVNAKSIVELNKKLEEYRQITGDVYLNAFMGLRSDGHYRRRLDYKTARLLIESYIGNK